MSSVRQRKWTWVMAELMDYNEPGKGARVKSSKKWRLTGMKDRVRSLSVFFQLNGKKESFSMTSSQWPTCAPTSSLQVSHFPTTHPFYLSILSTPVSLLITRRLVDFTNPLTLFRTAALPPRVHVSAAVQYPTPHTGVENT